jgi:sRNA-binding protein
MSRSRKYRDEQGRIIDLLAEHWPQTFFVYELHRRPLKVGIHLDIAAALGDELSEFEIKIGLRAYTSNLFYLKQLRPGAVRINLVTEKEAAWAVKQQKVQSKPPKCRSIKSPDRLASALGALKKAARARRAA